MKIQYKPFFHRKILPTQCTLSTSCPSGAAFYPS